MLVYAWSTREFMEYIIAQCMQQYSGARFGILL